MATAKSSPPPTDVPPSETLVADRVFDASTLDAMEEVGNRLVSPHRVDPRGRGRHADASFQFHGSQDIFSLRIRYGREVSVLHPDQADDRIAFVTTTRGRCLFVRGQEEVDISNRQGLIFATGQNIFEFGADSEATSLVLNRRKIAASCSALMGRELHADIKFEMQTTLDNPAGQSWFRLFDYATTELADPLSLVRTATAARQQLEHTVITGLLLSQRHNYADVLLQPEAAAAPYYVKRAEAFIEANFAEPLSLAEIAIEANVSARSLQGGFRNFRNMTPMEYLRKVRLNAAHTALLAADPATATATQIALQAGFTHMGEFAAQYRKTFGVSPRQTLWRAC